MASPQDGDVLYTKALDYWSNRRNRGDHNLDGDEIRYLIENHVKKAIDEYMVAARDNNVNAEKKAEKKLRGVLNDMVEVLRQSGQPPLSGAKEFFGHLYKHVFQPGHQRFVNSLEAVARKERRMTTEDKAIQELLKIPCTFYPQWNFDFIPEIQCGTMLRDVGRRTPLSPPITRQNDEKKKLKTVKRTGEAVAVKKGPPVFAPAEGGLFRVGEPQEVAEFQKWNSKVLLWQPRFRIVNVNENIRNNRTLERIVNCTVEMLSTLDIPGDLPRMDDLILLKQEAQFWLEEFFNFFVNPCDFSNPTELRTDENYSKYRQGILVPLVKLAALLNNTTFTQSLKNENPIVFDQLMQPLMTLDQWKEYLSLNFPDAAALLFYDRAQAINPDFFLNKYTGILSALEKIQELFVIRPLGQRLQQPKRQPIDKWSGKMSGRSSKRSRDEEDEVISLGSISPSEVSFEEMSSSFENENEEDKSGYEDQDKYIDILE